MGVVVLVKFLPQCFVKKVVALRVKLSCVHLTDFFFSIASQQDTSITKMLCIAMRWRLKTAFCVINIEI